MTTKVETGVPHPLVFKGAGFTAVKRNPLRPFYGRGDLHFLTFSCYRRRPFLGTPEARNQFVRVLDQVRSRHNFKLFGYVVMPEHVHLLVTEPAKGTPSSVLQALKQVVSRRLRHQPRKGVAVQLAFGLTNSEKAVPAFWQPRFYDFNVRSAKKVREKLESGETETGVPSKRLAVEQLVALCES